VEIKASIQALIDGRGMVDAKHEEDMSCLEVTLVPFGNNKWLPRVTVKSHDKIEELLSAFDFYI